ncbi:MAG: hypothetical protein ABSE62_00410 [Chthoniobacteraceae bacterium]|jgi:hypothetical protein
MTTLEKLEALRFEKQLLDYPKDAPVHLRHLTLEEFKEAYEEGISLRKIPLAYLTPEIAALERENRRQRKLVLESGIKMGKALLNLRSLHPTEEAFWAHLEKDFLNTTRAEAELMMQLARENP